MTDMMKRNIRSLELDKILSLLAEETACEDAAELARALEPSSSLKEVKRLLADTFEAHGMMARFGSPSFSGLRNVTASLRRAEAGGLLTMGELLRVAGVLRTLRGIVEWRARSEGVKTVLDWRFDALMPNKYLEDRINTSIISEEEMASEASPELASIRRKIRNASARAREQLDKMIRSPMYQKYLQDPIVTMRGGRFVVPVKAECRGDVPGLVHDTSSSGATVFVEPMAVVEANNEIRVLLSREQAEIERILAELSAEAGGFASGIVSSYEAAVQLNLIFAKANLGYKMKATIPEVNDEGKIELKRARHPLIAKEKVVPTDIQLGLDFDTLVITGPNTGGKTVSIKTIGLMTLMAMCGLLLPVADGSRVSVFGKVLSDIGDEQSIEQSLSTFSAHMTNIIRILSETDDSSLVLLDELGAGTDPVEGAALATAILEALRRRGARIASTTHYAELKAYALQTEGVENGCCEFDVATLKPTYRLLIGVPGRSNAFAISLRLGMEEAIVERARELVSSENTRFEDIVQSLEESRQRLESERAQAEEQKLAARRANEEAAHKLEQLEEQAEKEMEQARQRASELISRTRAQVDSMLNEVEELRKKQNKLLTAEQKAKLKSGMKRLEEEADPIRRRRQEEGEYVLPRPLRAGDTVLIYDINKKASVLEVPPDGKGPVLVQAGIIRMRVPQENLRLSEPEKEKKDPRARSRNVTKQLSSAGRGAMEIDLRGQMVEEGILNVDRFLDSASMAGVHQVTIIHGKGTGRLRAAVQAHLRHHQMVKSFRLGAYGEGEAGVTVVELK